MRSTRFPVLIGSGLLVLLIALFLIDRPPARNGELFASGRDVQEPVREERLVGQASPARREDASLPARIAAKLEQSTTASDSAERPNASLEIDVVDESDHPAKDVKLLLTSAAGPHPWFYEIEDDRGVRRTAVSDGQGSALFAELPAGSYVAVAESADGRRASRPVLVVPEHGPERVRLPAKAYPHDVLVHVIGTTGTPVAGAQVEVTGSDVEKGIVERSPLVAVTDTDGVARFEGREFSGVVVLATAPDGRRGKADKLHALVYEATVVVDSPGRLEGTLNGLAPEALEGARVLAFALNGTDPYSTSFGLALETRVEGGRYRFEALAPGTWTLAIDDPGGARLVLPPLWSFVNSIDPIEVDVRAGETSVQELDLAQGGTLAGIVRRPDEAIVAGADVRLTYAPRSTLGTATNNMMPDAFTYRGVNVWTLDYDDPCEHPLTHLRARTDPQGCYRFAGLQPGIWRVEVFASGLVYDRREEVTVADGAVQQLEHVLAAAGMIQGVEPEPEGSYLGVTRIGEERARMIAALGQDGGFTFPGLEAGEYELVKFDLDSAVEPVPLAQVPVVAGRRTWADLRSIQRPAHIAGRLLGPGGPVSGAKVSIGQRELVTDHQGRFETSITFPHYVLGILVNVDGVMTRFRFSDAAAWAGDLLLGDDKLEVRTLDESGSPAPAVLRLLRSDSGKEEDITDVWAEGLAVDGARTLSGLPPGEYQLMATFENGAEVEAKVRLPASREVVLHAPPTGDLDVFVHHADGSPAERLTVTVWIWSGEGAPPEKPEAFEMHALSREARTDERGCAHFAGLSAAELLVGVAESRKRLSIGPGEQKTLLLQLEDGR